MLLRACSSHDRETFRASGIEPCRQACTTEPPLAWNTRKRAIWSTPVRLQALTSQVGCKNAGESGRWLTEKVTGAFPSNRSTTNHLKGVATPMTDLKFALMELLRKYQPDQDMLREGLQLLAEALMELEVTQKVGAGRYERTSQRTNYRNGYRLRN